jgi:hypothetical protein
MGSKNWIRGAIGMHGKLHRELGVPENQPIPADALASAAQSPNPTIKKEAVLARTLKGFNKRKGAS